MMAFDPPCDPSSQFQLLDEDLHTVIQGSKTVLVLDDSGSTQTPVRLPGENPFLPATQTRWTNLLADSAAIVQLAGALNPVGVDVHFLNRF